MKCIHPEPRSYCKRGDGCRDCEGGCMSSLGEEFPKEQERVRTILGYYKEIGPAGLFGAAYIEEALRRADRAAVSGDVVALIQSYQELKKIEA